MLATGELRAVVIADGRTVLDIAPRVDSGNWSTSANGGFATCELVLPGLHVASLPYLSLLRLTRGTDVLFEGLVQDRTLTFGQTARTTTIQAVGLQSRLAETSLRRIWVWRDLPWQESASLVSTSRLSAATNALAYHPSDWGVSVGQFDQTDLTRIGLAFTGDSIPNSGARVSAAFRYLILPGAGSVQRILFTAQANGSTSDVAGIRESADGTTWTEVWSVKNTARTSYTVSVLATSQYLQFIGQYDNTVAGIVGASVTFENIRMLGTQTTEDATGGLYGGTILRDVINQIPDITLGIVEDGSDFTIESLERHDRDMADGVVKEAAAYYTREWGVWEDGRFDWKSVNFDEIQYILTANDLQPGSQVEGTIADTPARVIVQYPNAAGFNTEASATVTDQRNPYVKQGRVHDEVVQAGFPMTNVTAAQLAARVAADHGSYPTANGRIVLNLTMMVQRANGSAVPAYMIRGGENILIRDLPKTDAFASGRDGETAFHVVSAQADLDAQLVTLELEGQVRRSDVLLARLAARTKTLTG